MDNYIHWVTLFVEGTVKSHYLGTSKVSCIERLPHFRGKFLSRKPIWDIAKCPGVLISGVSFKKGSTVILFS